VYGLPVAGEHREIDPREVVAEPGAPDDVGDIEHAAVLQQRQAFARAHDPGHTFDSGGSEVAGLRPDERSSA
jgi:hypothetical protein